MPSRDKHIAKIQYNYSFLLNCVSKIDLRKNFALWEVIIRFYICVHIVEAILSTINVHSDNHAERERNIRSNANLFDLNFQTCYFYLKESARIARYNGKLKMNPNRLNSVVEKFELIVKHAKDQYGILIETPAPIAIPPPTPTV